MKGYYGQAYRKRPCQVTDENNVTPRAQDRIYDMYLCFRMR